MDDRALRKTVHKAVAEYFDAVHEPRWKAPFVPGQTPIPVSGKVYDAEDMVAVMESVLDFWLTAGRFAAAFEGDLAACLGVKHALLCNSGSSANLLAIACLTSPKLRERRVEPGDEVITLAAGFPTTVNPIVQNRLVPVFVDVDIPTYNVETDHLEEALGPRTRAVFLSHTLGNPFDLDSVVDFCRRHDLWLVEDSCDALGALYRDRPAGSFGDIATFSFYPAHHITMGEGGAVVTDNGELRKLVASFRDWGRDCWCETGRNDTCKRRFDQQFGDLPVGYDHKYVYSHIGYNLKATDMQAALGVSQLKKLLLFAEVRRQNFDRLYDGLKDLEEFFILPQATLHAKPSWFGFPIAVRTDAPFSRRDLIRHLDAAKIDTRLLFGGNLIRQPAFKGVPHRRIGELQNSDFVMNQVFWIGVYPGLNREMIDYMIETIHEYVRR